MKNIQLVFDLGDKMNQKERKKNTRPINPAKMVNEDKNENKKQNKSK